MKTFKLFTRFSCLKSNILKCEIKMAVCGIKCSDLTTEIMKIVGAHFPYNQKLQTQKKFVKSITNMQNVFNIWRMSSITLEGKIIIAYLTLIT